jgi:hypothetical protein
MHSFLQAVKASQSDLVYLVRGEEKHSQQAAWYYIQISGKAKAPVFLKNIKTGVNLTEYGIILHSGWGKEPPEDIKQKIKDQFG